jgi:hypothetical protein
MLEERKCDHTQHGVVVQPVPRTSLEVVEAEFLLHLLMHLFARPTSFDARDDPEFVNARETAIFSNL